MGKYKNKYPNGSLAQMGNKWGGKQKGGKVLDSTTTPMHTYNSVLRHRINSKDLKNLLGNDYGGLSIAFNPVADTHSTNRLIFSKLVKSTTDSNVPGEIIIYTGAQPVKYETIDSDNIGHHNLDDTALETIKLNFEDEKEEKGFEFAFFTKSQLEPIRQNKPEYIDIYGVMIDFGSGMYLSDKTGTETEGLHFTFLLVATGKEPPAESSPIDASKVGGNGLKITTLPTFAFGTPCPPIWPFEG